MMNKTICKILLDSSMLYRYANSIKKQNRFKRENLKKTDL